MPRTYTRKTDKQSWTEEQLLQAINSIKNDGSSIRGAGKQFGIPESTIRDKLKVKDEGLLPKLGRRPIFTDAQEQEIVDHLVKLANMFYGLTPIELRRLAYDYATKLNLKHNFDEENKLAGKDWLYGFLKRNPNLTLRQPDNTSINRISSFNSEEVKRFYSNLEIVYQKHSYPPSRIFNQDETGISNVQKKSAKIYAKKGQKRVGAATSAERGRTITLVCCISAAGSYVPPMIIYPRMRMAAHLKRGGPPDALYECSKNGWSNEQLFVKWLEHFCTHTKPSVDDPILLICDNHGSHITLDAYEMCKKNHITVVSIPPHTSHRLQPLDLTFFGPLKGALSREFGLFMTQNAHTKIITSDIPGLLNKAYMKVATMEKGVKGFASSGIYPLNPDQFTAEDFAPANEFQELIVEDDAETPSKSEGSIDYLNSLPGPSSKPQCEPQDNRPGPTTSTISVKEIVPIPKHNVKNKVASSSHKKLHSEILTSTPIKLMLEKKRKEKEDKEKSKIDRQRKQKEKLAGKGSLKRKLNFEGKRNGGKMLKKRQKLKKTIEDYESSDESDIPLKELCDDDELDDIDLTDQNNEVCFYCEEGGRDNELWYRCILCGFWAHADCSGWDSAEDYECDRCVRKIREKEKKNKKIAEKDNKDKKKDS